MRNRGNFHSIISSKLQPSAFITISYLFLFLIQHIRDGEVLVVLPRRASPFTIHGPYHGEGLNERGGGYDEGDFIADTRETDRYTESIVSSYWLPRSRIFPKSISPSRQCCAVFGSVELSQSYIASNYYIIRRVNAKRASGAPV